MRKQFYHSWKELPKFSEIVKFGCKIFLTGKYSNVKFVNFVYFCITWEKALPHFHIEYKIRKLYRTIFSTFYNILQPNFTISLNLGSSVLNFIH